MDSQQQFNVSGQPVSKGVGIIVIAAVVGLVLLKKLHISVSA